MRNQRAMLLTSALAAFCALLIGYFTLKSDAGETAGAHPHDKANHHPKHLE